MVHEHCFTMMPEVVYRLSGTWNSGKNGKPKSLRLSVLLWLCGGVVSPCPLGFRDSERRHLCIEALWAVLFLSLMCVRTTEAAFEFHDIGCRAIGLGGGYVALAEGPEGIFWNPAGLARSDRSQVLVFYGRPFAVQALSIQAFGGVAPASWGSIGGGVETYGDSFYREVSAGVAYGWALERGLSLGIRLRYGRLSITRFGSAGVLCMDVGASIQVWDALRWGLSVQNLAGTRIGGRGERAAQTVLMGVSGTPADRIELTLDVRKDLRFPLQLGAGAEVLLSDVVRLWTGVRSDPLLFSSGLGLDVGSLLIQYAVTYHAVLGVSHYASIGIMKTPALSSHDRR